MQEPLLRVKMPYPTETKQRYSNRSYPDSLVVAACVSIVANSLFYLLPANSKPTWLDLQKEWGLQISVLCMMFLILWALLSILFTALSRKTVNRLTTTTDGSDYLRKMLSVYLASTTFCVVVLACVILFRTHHFIAICFAYACILLLVCYWPYSMLRQRFLVSTNAQRAKDVETSFARPICYFLPSQAEEE
jgi:hypothetical protein